MSEPGPSTRVVRAGLPEPEQGEPFLPGPGVRGARSTVSGDPYAAPHAYTRYGNPTWARYEEAVGSLESAEAVLFSSGMAAAAALLLTQPKPGSVLAMDSGCYHGVRALAETYLEPRGVELRLAPPAELADAADGADLLWLESPSNPKLEVYDIAALASRDVTTVVDNTTAGPLLQRRSTSAPTSSLTSATKQMSGHADLLLGYVTTRDAERAEALRDWRRYAGAIPGPFETWLAHRSLPTLALRLERGCDNALAIARLLAARDDVEGVRYPGLPGDPGHEVARRQMRGYGDGRLVRPRQRRARRALPRRRAPGDRRDQLRQRPHERRAARPLGRRRRAGGLHPPVGGLRGHGRPAGGRRAGARRRARSGAGARRASPRHGSEHMEDWVWWMIAAGVLAVGEMATLGFFLGPIAVAAVLAAIVALAGGGLAVQWIVFIVGVARLPGSCCGRSRAATCARRRRCAPARPRWSAAPATVLERVDARRRPRQDRRRDLDARAPTTRTTRSSPAPGWRS